MSEEVENLLSVVLISDDNHEDVQLLLDAMVRVKLNCEAIVSSKAAKTIKAIEQKRPDILIIDIDHCKSKSSDGFDVIRYIREHKYFRSLPIIIFTSSTSQEDINQSFKLRVNGYIIKPQTPDELEDMMESVKSYCDANLEQKTSNLKRIRELTLALDCVNAHKT